MAFNGLLSFARQPARDIALRTRRLSMKRFISILIFTLLFSISALAHQAFTLVSSERKTVREADLAALEKSQTIGKKDGKNLTFTELEIRIIVLTGPEDDMLSYRIQGIRNPNLVVPTGATLKILFVNVDADMRHDVRLGHVVGDFPVQPEIEETAGSQKLTARTEDGTLPAEELVIKSSENGAYKYFCSVRGHAKGGMWGNILVGVKPGTDLNTAEKTEHVHSPDEDKDDHQHQDETKPHVHDEKTEPNKTEKKPIDEKSEMNHQHDEHGKTDIKDMSDVNHGNMEARSTVNIGEPMTRESSGTAWVPDSSPMHAYMKMYEDGGMLMLHGNLFFRYTNIGSTRDVSVAGKGSDSRVDALSMFMAMYSKPVTSKSQIGLRAMLSLDPLIERGYGYPLLYQSGELYRGQPIHDRQHPHDFFSELAVTFSHKFNDKQSMFIYAGLPGESALGPPTFMHRISGMNNPDAPLSHHWQDATHITFGVATVGYVYDKVKFEVSAFNGTEPDENRWDIDKPRLNSFSGRLSFNPNKNWAFQISHGYLKNPERAEPDLKILRRTTASAIYNKKFGDDRNLASSFIWGQNRAEGERSNSFLFEADYQFQKNAIFSRIEQVQKNSHELVLPVPHPEGNLWVSSYSIGYLREFYRGGGLDFGLGGQITFNHNPQSLVKYYGATNHQGYQIFFRIRPSAMKH